MNKVQVVVLELEAKTKTIAELVLDLKTQLTQVLPKSTMRLVPTVVVFTGKLFILFGRSMPSA